MSQINVRELSLLYQEMTALANKPNWSKTDEQRNANCMARISAVKAGATLAEVDEQLLNADEQRNGFKPTRLRKPWAMTPERRAKAVFMQQLVESRGIKGHEMEMRDGETIGNPIPQIGTYSGLGVFVPTDMYSSIFNAMAWYDPLYDPDVCTVIRSSNGRPLRMPLYDDITNVAVQVGEASADSGEVLLGNPDQVTLGGFSFRTPIQKYSVEAIQDIEGAVTAYDIFQKMASDRLARGIGAKLINGAGVTEPLGLVTALTEAGAPAITAKGRSGNTGVGTDTGANSVGSTDLADVFYAVNEAYRVQPKCGWLMNDTTLTGLMGMVSKLGLPLVNFFYNDEDNVPAPYILNRPVHICPSLASPSEGDVSVIFGDLGYWATRLIAAGDGANGPDRVQIYRERYAETGQVGMQVFVRADGALLYDGSTSSHAPMAYLVNHS
jgi:HK97 family phage major capsid protein